jgi:tRNA pseudouridine38-40 synthase
VRNIALIISYNGSKFSGWQKQKDQPTIQAEIENAIKKLTNEEVNLIGASRTDAGVHALNQVANFFTNSNIAIENFPHAISAYLPPSIVIKNALEVSAELQRKVLRQKKTYLYVVDNSPFKNPLLCDKTFYFPYKLNLDLLFQAKKSLIGEKDFKAFMNQPYNEVENTIRTMYEIEIEIKNNLLFFFLTANGFLYRMARNIVGSLLDIGRGKLTLEDLEKAVEQKNRQLIGFCAPPHALYLYRIYY